MFFSAVHGPISMGTSNIAQVGVNHNCELRHTVASTVSCRRCFSEPSASIEARDFLSRPDDNVAVCTSSFEVSDSLAGRLERKDPIHYWPNSPRIDEVTDLA